MKRPLAVRRLVEHAAHFQVAETTVNGGIECDGDEIGHLPRFYRRQVR
ncbi:hypothetical protein [Paraburkholderia terrae]|jgi:hypothetical protein|nr:hypothetical protein [Paraburkholderia terrae]